MLTRTAVVTISTLGLFACTPKFDFKIPSPDAFPHNWLKARTTVEKEELQYQQIPERQRPNNSRENWNKFKTQIIPGDELWTWEEPDHSKFYYFGYCIVRQNKIVVVWTCGQEIWSY